MKIIQIAEEMVPKAVLVLTGAVVGILVGVQMGINIEENTWHPDQSTVANCIKIIIN